MASLSREYRPRNFKEVVGQSHVKITLQNEIQAGRVNHAYLFCGPRAVGKTTFARLLPKAINCLERKEAEYEPCNKCEACEEINQGRSLDIIEIDAASHTGVDNVRENIIASARVSPSKRKFKVFIIDEVHMLSISAFNALLKIIEEPPANVIFILCTTEVHKVPTTIISRCQRFDFKRISVNDIVKKLNYIIKKEKIEIKKNILESIARHSEGHMRDAESLLDQIISIGGKDITEEEADLVIPRSDIGEIIRLLEFLAKKDSGQGIKLVNELMDSGVDLKTFINDLIEILRKMMLNKVNPGMAEVLGLELGEALEIKISEVNNNLALEQLIAFINKFIEVKNKVKDSKIPQLPAEIAITELCLAGAVSVPGRGNPLPEINTIPRVPLKASAPSQSTEEIDISLIEKKWPEVLAKIKKYNHSLSFILRACQPRDVKGNQLCLVFKYKFHKDRVNNIEIKPLIEKAINEVYGSPFVIEAIIDENLEIDTNKPQKSQPTDNQGQAGEQDVISDLLKTFGGKVIK